MQTGQNDLITIQISWSWNKNRILDWVITRELNGVPIYSVSNLIYVWLIVYTTLF